MLKIEFSIATPEEAWRSSRIALAIAREFDGPGALLPVNVAHPEPLTGETEVAGVAPKRRGRPPKVDPVAAYVTATGGLPNVEPAELQTTGPLPAAAEPEPAPVAVAAETPEPAPAPLPAPVAPAPVAAEPAPADRETLLAKVRALAQTRGALWLRAVLSETPKASLVPDAPHPARKLSDLSDVALAAVLESVG